VLSAASLALGSTALAEPVSPPVAPLPAQAPELGGGEAIVQGAPEAALPPALPADVVPGISVSLAVPSDRSLFVVHAPAENRRAIIYLHGMCGNVHAVDVWKEAAANAGTVITLVGDKPCGGGRFRWGKSLDAIEARVEAALSVVKAARGGLLDIEHPVLFGYSQGAARAEGLVARHPTRYRRVVLGGSPREPQLLHLGEAQAIAVFGGELETFGHMRAGAEVLAAAGKTARFFLFPKAKHGDFGPSGNRVMGEVFSWLLADDAS
jgi:pimeloyl-ACP methyl ester carboxylesterase